MMLYIGRHGVNIMSRMFKVEIINNGKLEMIIITNERLTDGKINQILFTLNLLSNVLINRYYAYEMDPERWILDEE